MKKIFILASLVLMVFILGGCSKQTYKDDKYDFTLSYPSNWSFINLSGNKFFIKKPLTQKDMEAGKVSGSDCALRFNALDNTNGKNLDDFWIARKNKETIRLGNNNFLKMVSPDGKDVTYSISNSKKQIFVFDGNNNCKSDNESILSTLVVN